MKAKHMLIHSLIPLSMLGTVNANTHTDGLDWELYGSLRLAAETVDADQADDYSGLRDAYTRIGAKATYAINDEWNLMGQLEAPFDLANVELQSPFDPTEDYRIGKLQISGPLGTAWYGRGWMAFYNYIQYPTDYFSSYYSGWDTYTTFRRSETFYYSSPRFSGLQFVFASTDDNGTEDDNRNQYVLSYANGGLSLAIGRDDSQNAANFMIDGASASYTTGPWYVAGQYQKISSDAPTTNAWNSDNNELISVMVQYAIDDKNTIRGKIANVENYGEDMYHIGWDHQYNNDLKVFAEYYSEETTNAINTSKNPNNWTYANNGGQALTVGVRYDFSTK